MSMPPPTIVPGEECVGALVPLPRYVTGEGAPYRPVAVMWIDAASHYIIDATVVRPEEALARAAGLFLHAMREPKEGPPVTPERLRVSDPTLATALRGSIGDVELVIGPTPEVDEIVELMTEHLSASNEQADGEGEGEGGGEGGLSFIGPDMNAADVAAMFSAAARLYRAAPWTMIPPDVCIGVSCDVMGIEDGAMVIVGQMGQAHGFSLFTSMEATLAFFDAIEDSEMGEAPDVPGHIMFGYDSREEMPASLVREVAQYRWEVANSDAYPSPTVIDDDRVARDMTRVELVGVTAILWALAELVETEPGLAEAWEREDAAITWNRTVETPLGNVTVELRAPVVLPFESSAAAMVAEDFLDENGELDEDLVDEYAETLLDKLSRMPGVDEVQLRFVDLLITQAAQFFGVPILQITPKALQTLLLDHIPSKVAIAADAAPVLIEATRLLMQLGAEALKLDEAKECLALVTAPEFARRLAAALGDDTRYSPAKAMMLEGMRLGYDLSTEKGVSEWVDELARRGKLPKPVKKQKAKPTGKAKPKAQAKAKAKAKVKAKTKAKTTAKPPTLKSKAKATTKATPKAKTTKSKPASKKRR